MKSRLALVCIMTTLVAGFDQVTKVLATGPWHLWIAWDGKGTLGGNPITPTRLELAMIAAALSAICLGMMLRSRLALLLAGLCAGGIIGNLLSYALWSRRGANFIQLGNYTCNFADVSIALGAVGLGACAIYAAARGTLIQKKEPSSEGALAGRTSFSGEGSSY